MSTVKKVVLNTGSQVYMAALAVLTLPFYLSILGHSNYGLIAFFIQLQTVITLLDIGISATVSRNTTLYSIKRIERDEYLRCVNSAEILFAFIALIIGVVSYFGNFFVVSHWIDVEDINLDVAAECVFFIGIIIAIRWQQTFYRAVLFGAEKIDWVSWFNILFSSVRVLGALAFLWFFDLGISEYFVFQLLANLIELALLYLKVNRYIRYSALEHVFGVSIQSLFTLLKSSAFIGATAFIWAMLTQADKFVMLGVSSLSEYTAFSIVVMASSVLVLLSAPLIYAIGPRMSRLLAEGNTQDVVATFRNSSLFVSIVLGACFSVGILWSESLLWVWTGDSLISQKASSFVPLYLSGTLIFALNYLSYSICFAFGDFRERLKWSVLSLIIYLPLLYFFSKGFRSDGVVLSWFLVNTLFFLFAQPKLYQKLGAGVFYKSLVSDLLIPIGFAFISACVWLLLDVSEMGRVSLIVFFVVVFFSSLFSAVFFTRARKLILIKYGFFS